MFEVVKWVKAWFLFHVFKKKTKLGQLQQHNKENSSHVTLCKNVFPNTTSYSCKVVMIQALIETQKNKNWEHFSRYATQCFWSITAESGSLQSCQFKGSIKLLTANTVWISITTSAITLIPPWVIISACLGSSRWVEPLESGFSFLSLVQLVHF